MPDPQMFEWDTFDVLKFSRISSNLRFCTGALRKKLVIWLRPLFQASATLSERHQERNQKVPGRPPQAGPPWKLLVSLLVSQRELWELEKWAQP
jgi:hypothetical protein